MKKMLVMLAAVVSAGFAFCADDDLQSGDGFELLTGSRYVFDGRRTDTFDIAGEGVPAFWYGTNDFTSVVTNYDVTGYDCPIPQRPDFYVDQVNTKGLEMECGTIYRTIFDCTSRYPAGEGEFGFEQQDIGAGVYFDSLMMLTAHEDYPEVDGNSKITIGYVEHVADTEIKPGDVSFTNIVVSAGWLDADACIRKDYLCKVPEGFNKREYHRVTIRAIDDIRDYLEPNYRSVGFVVYIDEQPLTYDLEVTAMDEENESQLNVLAQSFYNSTIHALFPSAIRGGVNQHKLSCASFSGAGFIDDISFSTKRPGFISENKRFTLNWTKGMTGFTVNGLKDGSFTTNITADAEGSVNLELNGDDDTITVVAAYDTASGWQAGVWTASDNITIDQQTGTFSGIQAGNACNLVAIKPLYTVNDIPFDDVDLAVEAAAAMGVPECPAVLKLLVDSGTITLPSEAYITIDLNGHDMQGEDGNDATIYNGGAFLTIINSSDTAANVYVPNDSALGVAVYCDGAAGGFTTVDAGIYHGDVFVDGAPDDDWTLALWVNGGTFYDMAEPETIDDFYIVALGCCDPEIVTDVGDFYFQVGGGEPPVVTFVDFVVTPVEKAEYTLTTNGFEVAVVDDVARVIKKATVLVTAMPATEEGAYYDAAKLPSGWVLDSFTGFASCEVVASTDPTEVAIPEPQVGGGEFAPGETYGEVTLDDETAAWLNDYGDFEGIKPVIEVMSADEFEAIYLLNLDVYAGLGDDDGINVSDIAVDDDTLTVTIDLSRDSAYGAAINGKLIISGAMALGGEFAPVAEFDIDDKKFEITDTATATVTVTGTDCKFFEAEVVRDAE